MIRYKHRLAIFIALGCCLTIGCSGSPTVTSEKVTCRSPSKADQSTKVHKWKFEKVKTAILDVVGSSEDGIAYEKMVTEVGERLSKSEQQSIGKLPWFIKTVCLELEVSGDLERFPPSSSGLAENLRTGSGNQES